MKKWLKCLLISIIVIIILVVIIAIVLFKIMHMTLIPIDGDNPPIFIQADFVELDKIYSISKFRSGAGHDFSVYSGETCRSMKHYFSSMDPDQPNYKMEGKEMIDWPHPVEGTDVTIFSPVDGKIERIDHDEKKGWVGDEMVVVPDSYPNIRIRLMHVTPLEGVNKGDKVSAGQKIGLVSANQSFDIAISSISPFKISYISYFAAMPDDIFAEYQARGVESRDELIITKEYRDANPFECREGSEEFAVNYAGTPEGEAEHMVHLSGYEEVIDAIWGNEDKDLKN